MTLQVSGPITLGQIHAEANDAFGTFLTLVSISDSDVRALISAGFGQEVSFSDFYGASYPSGGGGGEEP
jgi:hypothetical protein